MSYLFAFSYCPGGSPGKNTGAGCHFLLQWVKFCHNSSLWPVHLGWPCMAWLIASLSHTSPFAGTRPWSMKGPVSSTDTDYPTEERDTCNGLCPRLWGIPHMKTVPFNNCPSMLSKPGPPGATWSLLLPPCNVVVLVTQPCPTHGDSMDCNRPGSSVHGIQQERILEWVVISFSTVPM